VGWRESDGEAFARVSVCVRAARRNTQRSGAHYPPVLVSNSNERRNAEQTGGTEAVCPASRQGGSGRAPFFASRCLRVAATCGEQTI
jgi:hypothetical protein